MSEIMKKAIILLVTIISIFLLNGCNQPGLTEEIEKTQTPTKQPLTSTRARNSTVTPSEWLRR